MLGGASEDEEPSPFRTRFKHRERSRLHNSEVVSEADQNYESLSN